MLLEKKKWKNWLSNRDWTQNDRASDRRLHHWSMARRIVKMSII